jgi:hypothetical protein
VQEVMGPGVPAAVVRVMLHHHRWDDGALIRRYRLLTGPAPRAGTPKDNSRRSPQPVDRNAKNESEDDGADEEADRGKGIESLYAQVGLPLVRKATSEDEEDEAHVRLMASILTTASCGICMEDFSTKTMTSLSCSIFPLMISFLFLFLAKKPRLSAGHWFCNDCYGTYLVMQITDGASDAIRCAHYKCPFIVDPVTVVSLVSRDVYRKFVTFAAQRYIETDASLFRCRATKCSSIIHRRSHTKDIACPCGYISCSQCGSGASLFFIFSFIYLLL